jgi:ABC-type lipoprotein export system ATPase subunit
MQMIQFVSTVNLIQIKLMKKINKMKKILIQEFPSQQEFEYRINLSGGQQVRVMRITHPNMNSVSPFFIRRL